MATAGPTTPREGRGPHPNVKAPDNAICTRLLNMTILDNRGISPIALKREKRKK